MAIWVQIVGPNKYPLLTCWYCEWANPSHDITDRFTWMEEVHKPFMLGVESTVPVYFGVVEAKGTVLLLDFDLQ